MRKTKKIFKEDSHIETMIVGDLHGCFPAAQKAINSSAREVIFLGDIVDSYCIPIAEQLKTLTYLLDQKEMRPDRITLIMGNHELSYLDPSMKASGWNIAMDSQLLPYYKRILKNFVPYVWKHGYLISHAGVSLALLDHLGKTLEEYLEEGNYNQIGAGRGGRDPIGGLFWCDWSTEFFDIPDVNQIVGHSHGKSVRTVGGSINIDCINYSISPTDPEYSSATHEVLIFKSLQDTQILPYIHRLY